jgi:hypothetical protein
MASAPADLSIFLVSNPNFDTLALGRTFYPKPYTVGSIQHVLALPWATEYFVLPYWFFFFSLGLVAIWLVTLYVQTSLHLESRFLRRETRGFSRAQTGDALTSVVPLAWSVSMLMHASVHSFNFDDNTAGTVFSFNVLAYQWGWNYYFPSDLLRLFREGPKRVGHSAVEAFDTAEPYSALLLRFRSEHVRRLSLQGQFASRALPVLSPLSLFTHNPSADVVFEPATFFPLVGLGAAASSPALAESLAALETTNTPFFSAYAWVSSSPLFRLLAPVVCPRPNSPLTWGALPAAIRPPEPGENSALFTQTHVSPALHLLPVRPLQSLSLPGNKLYLIHRHLSSSPDFLNPGASGLFKGVACVSSLFPATLPLGQPGPHHLSTPVAVANLSSLALSATPLPDLTGWGALGFEDLGLTNSAAVKALLSGGANSARVHAAPQLVFAALPSSPLGFSGTASPAFADLGADWSASWLLSLRTPLATLGLVNFFATNLKGAAPTLAAQAHTSGPAAALRDAASSSLDFLLRAQPS